MSADKVIDSLGRIDEDLIRAVEELRRKKTRPARRSWGAIAACLCLLAAGITVWSYFGQDENIPEGGSEVGAGVPGGMWPDGVDPLIASVAVLPAGADLQDVADAVSVSITEEEARAVEELGEYLPSALPEGCRCGKAAHYRTMMKDGTEYHMLRVTYEKGEPSIPAPVTENPVTENAERASEMTGNTAFLWMVWGHLPDTDRPLYQPEEVSPSTIEKQAGRVFYIDYGGIYVGLEQLDITAEELFAIIESIR